MKRNAMRDVSRAKVERRGLDERLAVGGCKPDGFADRRLCVHRIAVRFERAPEHHECHEIGRSARELGAPRARVVEPRVRGYGRGRRSRRAGDDRTPHERECEHRDGRRKDAVRAHQGELARVPSGGGVTAASAAGARVSEGAGGSHAAAAITTAATASSAAKTTAAG